MPMVSMYKSSGRRFFPHGRYFVIGMFGRRDNRSRICPRRFLKSVFVRELARVIDWGGIGAGAAVPYGRTKSKSTTSTVETDHRSTIN